MTYCTTQNNSMESTDIVPRFNLRVRPASIKKKKKPPAEKQKEYRDNLKMDKDRYNKYVEDNKQRAKLYRLNRTEEQKANNREKSRLRSKKYRDNMKKKYGSTVPLSRQTNVKTRREVASQREYWRIKKQESRQNLSSQKKRRIKEYDRARKNSRQEVTNDKRSEGVIKDNLKQSISSETNFTSPEAERKALSRAKRSIPKEPGTFAGILRGLILRTSPRKKTALINRGIHCDVKENEKIKRIAQKLNKDQKKKGKQFRRKFVGLLKDSYVTLRAMSRDIGIRYQYLQKVSKLNTDEVWVNRKDEIEESTVERVKDFYVKPESSTVLPDVNKVSRGKNTYTLEKTLKKTYRDFLDQNKDVKIGLSKFCSLKPQNVKTYSNTPLKQCICEYCANVSLKLRILKSEIKEFPKDKYEAVNQTLCPKPIGAFFNKRECIFRECSDCGVKKLNDVVQQIQEGNSTFTWYKWDTITRKVGNKITSKKGLKSVTGRGPELITELKKELEELSIHLFVATWQHRQFSFITSNLQSRMVVMVLDFGQNFTCFYQDEAQAAHWAAEQVTIHPIICYYQCKTCNHTVKEDLVMLSGDLKHDFHAVRRFILTVNEHLIKKRGLTIDRHVQFSDGCAGQYKSKNAFETISAISKEIGCVIERHFFGSRHGKGPSDACTGVVKSAVTRAVKARQTVISCPEEMYKYCFENLTKETTDSSCTHNLRTFFLIKDVDHKRETTATTVPGTRKIHAVKSCNSLLPMQLLTRPLSCFCSICLNEQVETQRENYQHTDMWTQVDLITGKNPFKHLVQTKAEISTEKTPKGKETKKSGKKKSKKVEDKDIGKLEEKESVQGEETESKKSDEEIVILDTEGDHHLADKCKSRKQYFADILADVAAAETYEELKIIISHFSVEMDAIPEPSPLLNVSLTELPLYVDADVMKLIPNEMPDYDGLPIFVTGDGNCLPRSASVIAYGNEEQHEEFRVRILTELITNEDLYLDDNFLSSGLDLKDRTRQLSKQFAMYSTRYVPGDVLTPAVVRRIFRNELLDIAKPKAYMGIWQLFAIASVLKTKLFSVYPELGNPIVRADLHRLIMPRWNEHNHMVMVMWSSTRSDLTRKHWIPNHFIPFLQLFGEVDQIEIVDDKKPMPEVEDVITVTEQMDDGSHVEQVDSGSQIEMNDARQVEINDGGRVEQMADGDQVEDNGQIEVDDGGQVEVDDGGQFEMNDGGQVEVDDGDQFKEDDGGQVEVDDGGQVEVDDGYQFKEDDGGQFEMNDGGQVEVDDGDQFKEDNGQVEVNGGQVEQMEDESQVTQFEDSDQVEMNDGGQVEQVGDESHVEQMGDEGHVEQVDDGGLEEKLFATEDSFGRQDVNVVDFKGASDGDLSDITMLKLDDMPSLNDSTIDMYLKDISFEKDDVDNDTKKADEDSEIYCAGDYIVVKHGISLMPAVVDDWPWIRYFSEKKTAWTMNEKRFTIVKSDIHSKLMTPDISMCGSRILYKFKDFPVNVQ